MFDRRLVKHFDWGLLCVTTLICLAGIMVLYSAAHAKHVPALYRKQAVWYGIGVAAMVFTFVINYRSIERWAYVIHGGTLLLLMSVLVFGKLAGGSQRWIGFGPVSLQPSELAKVSVIIVMARYYARRIRPGGLSLKDLVFPALMVAIPFALIAKQPDLGTAMVVMLIAGSMTLFIKIEKRSFWFLVGLGIVSLPAAWSFLKPYQRQRIITFIDPDRDPLGAGYHIIQSKIAIGSGMLDGKGLLQGTQSTLAFLPEQHTDFIFSVLAEEWGFIGAAIIVALLLVLIVWGLAIAYQCKTVFGTVLCVGVSALLFWQAVINLGMVTGLMPVVGMPLPLVSYGGSSVLTVMICIGLLMNVSMRRFVSD